VLPWLRGPPPPIDPIAACIIFSIRVEIAAAIEAPSSVTCVSAFTSTTGAETLTETRRRDRVSSEVERAGEGVQVRDDARCLPLSSAPAALSAGIKSFGTIGTDSR
jgi:hypothetical protein